MSLQSPAVRVLGLGSARKGTQFFMAQRISAIALIPLCAWFVFSMIAVGGERYDVVRAWAGQPTAALLLGLFVPSLLYHAQLGVQVVIEDYVHVPWLKIASLVLLRLLAFLLAAAALLAVLRIALGG